MRVDELLCASAARTPRALAIRDADGELDFGALAELAASLAGGLARAGVARGDRVAVLAKNRREYVALYFAAAELDAVLVPINWRLAPREVEWVLAHARPAALVAEIALGRPITPPPGCRAFALDGEAAEWRRFEELAVEPMRERARAPDASRTAFVQMYTSGTTGKPKGAVLSHGNVTAMTRAWLADMPLSGAESRFLQVTPLFHVGGMLMVMSAVAAGSALHLLAEFDPVAALDVLERERITHTLMVPAMVQWCLYECSLRARSFDALEMIAYGAAPMPLAVLLRAIEVFRCDFLQGYGLTESSGVLLTLDAADHRFAPGEAPPRRLASAGRPVACSEVRVVDAEGRDVPRGDGGEGEVGEIVARGANMMLGYFDDAEASAECMRDGWFRTGDLARIDRDGYVYVVDRRKDMLIVGGENVYPREVEDALMHHADVADVAVIGVPHATWGEEVLALVVPRAGRAPEPRALIRHCRERLARFKCPTRVELKDALPRNSAGKLQKALLRAPYWEGLERRV